MTAPSPIPAFSDNYIWCIRNDEAKCIVVDPGTAEPVQAYLDRHNLQLAGILITHHHPDHTGGIAALTQSRDIPVIGPNNPSIKGLTQHVAEGDTCSLIGLDFRVLDVPGHTLDHIAFLHSSEDDHTDATPESWLFCGDTLFSGGCGRLFEGTPEQMLKSLEKLKALPERTQVFCAHEYTMANLKFAQTLMPENPELQAYVATCQARREQHLPTLPSTIATEAAINPFLRYDDPELISHVQATLKDKVEDRLGVFAATRRLKDLA